MRRRNALFIPPKGLECTLLSGQSSAISGAADQMREMGNALDHPIGLAKIEELARPGGVKE